MTQSQRAPRLTAVQEDDPIFAAIERHKAAVAATEAAGDNVPQELIDKDTALARSLMKTAPKTRAGLLALLRYVQDAEEAHAISLETIGSVALLATIESAVRFLGDANREHRSVTFAMEAPLCDARGLSMAMIMALAGENRVHGDEEDHADALERLANAVQDSVNQVFKLWSKLH